MSESQLQKAEEALERFSKKERVLNKLLWVLIGAIIVMISSVAALTTAQVENRKDIEYVREQAFNKIAAEKLVDAMNNKNASVQMLIKDENIKAAIEYFDREMAKVTDDIISWNSTINPRGSTYSGTGSSE